MIDMGALTSFMLVAAFTPGPNNILCLNNGIKMGLRKTYPFNLGVFFGRFAVNLFLVMSGAGLFVLFPQLLPIIRMAGVLYILYLAYKVLRSPFSKSDEQICADFQTAFLLQFINVKSMVTGVTAATVFVLPHKNTAVTLILCAAYISFFSLAGTLCWTLFGRLFQGFLARYKTAVSWVMALLLVYTVYDILV